MLQLAIIVGEFFTEADRVGPEAAAQFRFFLQEKARRSVTALTLTRGFSGRCQCPPFLLFSWRNMPGPCVIHSCLQEQRQAGAASGLAFGGLQARLSSAGEHYPRPDNS